MIEATTNQPTNSQTKNALARIHTLAQTVFGTGATPANAPDRHMTMGAPYVGRLELGVRTR